MLNSVKELNGREIAGFIKERQAKQVRRLVQADGIKPKLVIVSTSEDPASKLYMKLKKNYGADIQSEVDVHQISQSQAVELISKLNKDESVHGIIVQLPLAESGQENEILNAVAPDKDVDGLGVDSTFVPATPLAIHWLLEGYSIDLKTKKVLVVGKGRLVGAPLLKLLKNQGVSVQVADSKTENFAQVVANAGVIITATGKPGLITSDMISYNSVVVDAGVAEVDGQTKGDLADNVYMRDDLILSPKKGGVGPLTVSALFDNLIKSADSKS